MKKTRVNNIIKVSEGKIALYSTPNSSIYVDVIFKDETFWMTQKAMTELFNVDKSVISRHLKNIFEEEELNEGATVAKIATVQNESGREVKRSSDFYSLDAIIAVGYRVNSKKATRFRQWATQTLKEYIQKGYLLNEELLKNGRPFGQDYFDELMAEDGVATSMQDWLNETDNFLKNNRRRVLPGKGHISHDEAIKKVDKVYEQFRIKQDRDYISQFDREMVKYLKGNGNGDE
jgi:hypothetical protein